MTYKGALPLHSIYEFKYDLRNNIRIASTLLWVDMSDDQKSIYKDQNEFNLVCLSEVVQSLAVDLGMMK